MAEKHQQTSHEGGYFGCLERNEPNEVEGRSGKAGNEANKQQILQHVGNGNHEGNIGMPLLSYSVEQASTASKEEMTARASPLHTVITASSGYGDNTSDPRKHDLDTQPSDPPSDPSSSNSSLTEAIDTPSASSSGTNVSGTGASFNMKAIGQGVSKDTGESMPPDTVKERLQLRTGPSRRRHRLSDTLRASIPRRKKKSRGILHQRVEPVQDQPVHEQRYELRERYGPRESYGRQPGLSRGRFE